jgi:hemin uptake protein HemP
MRHMDKSPISMRSDEAAFDTPAARDDAPIVESTTLMGGGRELLIKHGAALYRLRVTASNKLILTK